MSFETEMGERYASELDQAAEILQRIHPIGQIKGLGRLEVVAALQDIERELNRLKWRINHTTDDDAFACANGKHKDCGK